LFLIILIGTVIAFASVSTAADKIKIFAGQDRSVIVGEVTTFDDARLVWPDPPDPFLNYTYSWDFDAAIDLDGDGIYINDKESTGLHPSFVFGRPGTYGVTLWAFDGVGGSANDTMMVTAIIDVRPVASILKISPNPAVQGDEVLFKGTGTDADGSVVEYLWRSDLNGSLPGNDSFMINTLKVGVHTITLEVRDDAGFLSASVSARLEVKLDHLPVLVILMDRTTADTATDVKFEVMYTDLDGDPPMVGTLFCGRNMVFDQIHPHEVNETDNDYRDGKVYSSSLKLKEVGNYSFYFEFHDFKGHSVRTELRYINVVKHKESTPSLGSVAVLATMLLAFGVRGRLPAGPPRGRRR